MRSRGAHRPADGLGNHVEGEEALVRAARPESLDLGVDDAWVDAADLVVAESQPLDHAWPEVLDEHIGLLDELAEQLASARVLQVAGDAALVGVQQQEVEGIDTWAFARGGSTLVAPLRLLDFDDFGSQPGQRFGTRGPGFELSQIDDSDACESGAPV